MDGEMIACESPSLLEFSWGEDTLRFELRPHESGTELTLIDSLAERGKAARDGAGWHVCLDQLAYHLDGAAPPWAARDRWGHVHDSYVEGFGPEAATIGPPEGA
jgi:Activator of Hsp90 ATPase homolog 1-like protein